MGMITLALGACGDLLTVSDPQRYTASDLDEALPAIGNGVEGALHEVIDSWAVDQALLADVYQHTGTWSGYDEVDHGRFQYGTSSMDGEMNSWLRARWFAADAAERFERVLEGAAATDPLMAQVHLTEGLVDLYIGLTYCESPLESTGESPASTAAQVLAQAVTKLQRAISTAAGSGTSSTYGQAAQAGLATAYWALNDLPNAAAAAGNVNAGFSYDAIFNQQSTNGMVTLTTAGNNEAAGLMYNMWDLIDNTGTSPGLMRDAFTDEPDMRKPVWYAGEIATDNLTPHYSQYKYSNETDDIPLVHYEGAQLIIAENEGPVAGTARLNTLRAAAGLSALPNAAPSAAEFETYLMNERWAEHFMEGMRMVDLRHFGESANVFNALDQDGNDYDGDGAPGDSDRLAAGRPIAFPMTATEALYNASIENDLAQRCLPTN
jgi:hypothetical protein